MKKTGFTDSQIMGILKQAENGMPVAELCSEHGMSMVGRIRRNGDVIDVANEGA